MTNRTQTLPLPPTETLTTAEVVTARALRRSLLPGFDLEAVATELVALAHNRRPPVNQAIIRIDRAQRQRASRVTERAQLALLAALDLMTQASRSAAA